MECGQCHNANDADARYCVNCGSLLCTGGDGSAAKAGRNWWYLLLLLPVLASAAGMGYYKFHLPEGVAAVVNNEEIPLAEVDAAAKDFAGGKDLPADVRSRMRYAVLSRMITDRIALQEARKAGIRISEEDVNAAVERSRMSAQADEKTFEGQLRERYGSVAAFRSVLEQQLAISRYIEEKVTAGAVDAAAAAERMDRWLSDIRAKAVVRIALAEELPAGGCGCCGGTGTKNPGAVCYHQKVSR